MSRLRKNNGQYCTPVGKLTDTFQYSPYNYINGIQYAQTWRWRTITVAQALSTVRSGFGVEVISGLSTKR